MGADLGTLFEYADADFVSALSRKLLQADRTGESRRSAADHNDVIFHGFACHGSNYNRATMTEHRRAPRAGSKDTGQHGDAPLRRLLHTELIPIRWGDMDAMRHVNNTVYFRFMEQARISWIDSMRGMLEAEGAGTVVVSTNCNYRKPFTYPGQVEVRLYVGRIGGSSITTLYEMRLQGGHEIYADGEAIIVWINMASGKAVRVPLAIRLKLGDPQGDPRVDPSGAVSR